MKLLITSPAFSNPHMQSLIQYAREQADEVVLNPYGRTMTVDELKTVWDGVNGVIAGLEPYSAQVLEEAPASLKTICRFGVGYDSVDLAAAKARGIAVTNTPGTNSDAVADLAIGMMIAIARHIPQGVAQEKANLVGEAPLLPQPGLQLGQGFLRLKGAVAVPGQEASGAGLVQVPLEPDGPEQVQQGPIPLAPQHPQGEPLSPEDRIPLGHLGFQAARVFQGDAEHAGRLDARQGGGAVFHQAALQREGRCDTAPPQAGRCPFCPRAGHGA